MAKKNNTAEKTILDAQKVSAALKEGTEKTLRDILNETISNIIKEDEDIDKGNVEEPVEDDSYEVEDVDTANSSDETDDVQSEEMPEINGDEGDSDEDNDDWSDMEEYKVGDNDYDFTGVDGETLLKVYNKFGDDDEIFVTKDEEGNYEMKDEETGAEYVIELNPEGEDADATDDDMMDDGDEEIEIEFGGDEEGGEDTDDVELELGDDEEGDEDGEIEIELGDEESDDEDDEDDEERLDEENLGYTDSYQKDVFAKKFNMSEPAKNANDWDEGAPKGAEKPWAGKGDPKPFGKKENIDEDGSGLNTKHAMKKSTNRINKDAQGQHVASEEGEYKGQLSESKAKQIIEAAKAIQAQNKLYKEEISKIKSCLQEAAVSNLALRNIVRLLVNETTSKDEKISICERFSNVKTINEGHTLYESIKKELNTKSQSAPITERQINMENTPSLNETTIYQTQSHPALDMMARMENIGRYYGRK